MLRRRIVAFGACGTGHEYLFVVLLVTRANNLARDTSEQSFRCKARSAATEKAAEIYQQNRHSMRITVGYGGPARGPGAEAVTSAGLAPSLPRSLSLSGSVCVSQSLALSESDVRPSPVCPSVCLSVFLSNCVSVCLCLCLCMYVCVCEETRREGRRATEKAGLGC